ncbi:MAG: response regulator [Anaerolineales bacterium]|nr:MAG: response regulator [Anaerolineales bacterium]
MDKPVALIIEDDRDVGALFRHVLDVAGYQTEIVMDGREAMERLETLLPNIVLLDLQLPNVSGVQILKRMREDDKFEKVPVVVITAYAPFADSLPVEPDLLLLKPVDLNQLSSLVQRLQATQGALNEPAHDPLTGLYAFGFFTVRLAFSLERIKQSSLRRFGVMLADVTQLAELKKQIHSDEFNHFLRKLADQFRMALRPTDTMAWSAEDGFFLTLIENIPSPEAPLRIAARVRNTMKKFFDQNDHGLGLRANLGVLLCDREYEDIQMILSDINRVRTLLRERQYASPAIFDREMLKQKG